MQLGVKLYHGRPYHPQTQGKDERFHRTMDIEVLQVRRFADLADCQRGFDAWRQVYNAERPHEALDLAVPATRYRPSPISFPERLPAPQYHATDKVRRVGRDGTTHFCGRHIKLSQAFAGQHVAFRPTATDGVWQVFFMRFGIARVDLRSDPRDAEPQSTTVNHVSEQPSGLSPV